MGAHANHQTRAQGALHTHSQHFGVQHYSLALSAVALAGTRGLTFPAGLVGCIALGGGVSPVLSCKGVVTCMGVMVVDGTCLTLNPAGRATQLQQLMSVDHTRLASTASRSRPWLLVLAGFRYIL